MENPSEHDDFFKYKRGALSEDDEGDFDEDFEEL